MESTNTGICFYKRYENLDTNFIRVYLKLIDNVNVDNIHDIRVCIKKIRTFFKLMVFLYPDFKFKKNLRPFKQLFQKAGLLRSVHIHQEIIGKLVTPTSELFTEKMNSLNIEDVQLSERFKHDMDDLDIYDFIKPRRRIKPLIINNFEITRLKLYLMKNVNNIIQNSGHKHLNPNELHELRKQFKELDYLVSWIGKCLDISLLKLIDYERIHNFQDKMGKWHDEYDTLVYLKNLKFHFDGTSQSADFEHLLELVNNSESSLNQVIVQEIQEIRETLKQLMIVFDDH